jgi:hypothetical protein
MFSNGTTTEILARVFGLYMLAAGTIGDAPPLT